MSGRLSVVRKCRNCGNPKKFPQSEVKRGNGKYCSHRCRMVHIQKRGGLNRKTLTVRHRGYVLAWAPNHPRTVKGYVPQHIIRIEKKIGRFLQRGEEVHHKNGIKDDNRVSNLIVVDRTQHRQLHGVLVDLNGKKVCLTEACRLLDVDRGSFKVYRKRHGTTNQQTVNHYLTGTRHRGGKKKWKELSDATRV